MPNNKKGNNENRENFISAWIVIAIVLIVPLILTVIISKALNVMVPTMVWTASDITRLFTTITALMIAASLVLLTKKK